MNLIEELSETRSETLARFGLEGDDLDRAYGRGTWTVRQILHHLSDAETVLFERHNRHHLGQIARALEDEG